jgi:PilZ domain
MSTATSAALVQPVRNPYFHDMERRAAERRLCSLEATSHAIEPGPALSWGAVVNDISPAGLSVTLCFPFRPGTFLAVDLQSESGMVRMLMVRVQNAHDQVDGRWRLGCEFIKPLSESDMEQLVC